MHKQLSRNNRKCTFGHMRPAKIQISLCICSLIRISTWHISDSQGCKVSSDNNKKSDLIALMRRPILAFIGAHQKITFSSHHPVDWPQSPVTEYLFL